MSWPALRALRRMHPESEIHVLTRPRFTKALEGLSVVNKVHNLPTSDILEPLVHEQMDIQGSFDRVSSFVDGLAAEKYDWIVNFTFSPVSSYIAHSISTPETKVTGYTRYNDGYLSIPDDMSAYFYAQVGLDRPNRFHLIEIFASLVGVDLVSSDWEGPHPFPWSNKILPMEYFVIHVGASEASKSLGAAKWVEIIQELRKENDLPVVLVGAPTESQIGEQIALAFSEEAEGSVVDIVGATELTELFPILKHSKLLVGCDSAPMHMASLINVPTMNISLSTVNFWETGPRSMDSVILRVRSQSDVDAAKAAKVIHRCLVGEKQDLGIIHMTGGAPSYYALTSKEADFEWFMARALYLGDDFPALDSKDFTEALKHLAESNSIMLDQMAVVERTGDVSRAAPFIDRGEEIIETIGKLVPQTQTLIRWYQTEKIRIAPGEMKSVLARTMEIHRLFQKVLDLYNGSYKEAEKELR
jgi:ADP-heptose:LPS heptosyltransferase